MIGLAAMEPAHVTFGPFRLNRPRRIVRRDGIATELGQRACDILYALVAAKGAVVSKDALMAEVWPKQIVEENTLQAQISVLRRALGEAGQRYIITVPGRGYRLVVDRSAAEEIAAAEDAATAAVIAGPKARGQPSIAVLPFANLSGDPADEWLADGLAEDLIIELSRSHWFLVISRSASFTFKGRAFDVRQVGRDLGARYVVEGTIRRSGRRLRVAAQLTETEHRVSVWAERYDRALTDVFTIQDEITLAVSRAIEPVVESAEYSRMLRKWPGGLDAWEAWLRARWYGDAEEWKRSDRLLRRSIELDPGFALPHADRGYLLYLSATGGGLPFRETLAEAEAQSYEAVKLDPNGPLGHAVLSFCRFAAGNSESAMHHAALAEKLGPSVWHAQCSMIIGAMRVHNYAAVERHLATLRQINPSGSGRRVTMMFNASLHLIRGEYDLAAVEAGALVASNPKYPTPYWILISSLGHLGRRDEARSPLAQWVAMMPGHSAMLSEVGMPSVDPEDSRRILAGLRAAGWNG
jgi:TolB-like protein